MRASQQGYLNWGSFRGLSALVGLFYAVSVPLSTGMGMFELRDATAPTKERNTAVFQKIAATNPQQGEMAVTWDVRQKAITHEIAANGASGIDFVPFWPAYVYATDALRAADRAKIALVPHDKTASDQRTVLIVDDKHGCLMIGLDQKDKDSADDARGLLFAFDATKAPGTYVFKNRGDLKSRTFTPLQPGQSAAAACPPPTPQ